MDTSIADPAREPWNKGKLVGQKTPFKNIYDALEDGTSEHNTLPNAQ